MMLSVLVYKVRKEDGCPIYDTKRYACFDTLAEGKTFEEKFNNAFNVLRDEINKDRENNDMNLFEPIVISNVFLT